MHTLALCRISHISHAYTHTHSTHAGRGWWAGGWAGRLAGFWPRLFYLVCPHLHLHLPLHLRCHTYPRTAAYSALLHVMPACLLVCRCALPWPFIRSSLLLLCCRLCSSSGTVWSPPSGRGLSLVQPQRLALRKLAARKGGETRMRSHRLLRSKAWLKVLRLCTGTVM